MHDSFVDFGFDACALLELLALLHVGSALGFSVLAKHAFAERYEVRREVRHAGVCNLCAKHGQEPCAADPILFGLLLAVEVERQEVEDPFWTADLGRSAEDQLSRLAVLEAFDAALVSGKLDMLGEEKGCCRDHAATSRGHLCPQTPYEGSDDGEEVRHGYCLEFDALESCK